MATALMNVLPRNETVGKTFDLGGPEVMTIEQLTHYISEIIMTKRRWIDVPVPLLL